MKRTIPAMSLWLVGTVGILSLACLPQVSVGAEFYSWIDASGTMVLTDNPSTIPPEPERGAFKVRQYKDIPPAPADYSRHHDLVAARPTAPWLPEPSVTPVDPADLDVPMVSLDEPTQSLYNQYQWVPLLAPIYLSSRSVYGFWCHRNANNPTRAFEDYLRSMPMSQAGYARINRDSALRRGLGVGGYDQGNRMVGSGNQVYDQVLRERQALIERNQMLSGAAQHGMRSSPSCCGSGSSRASSSSGRAGR